LPTPTFWTLRMWVTTLIARYVRSVVRGSACSRGSRHTELSYRAPSIRIFCGEPALRLWFRDVFLPLMRILACTESRGYIRQPRLSAWAVSPSKLWIRNRHRTTMYGIPTMAPTSTTKHRRSGDHVDYAPPVERASPRLRGCALRRDRGQGLISLRHKGFREILSPQSGLGKWFCRQT